MSSIKKPKGIAEQGDGYRNEMIVLISEKPVTEK